MEGETSQQQWTTVRNKRKEPNLTSGKRVIDISTSNPYDCLQMDDTFLNTSFSLNEKIDTHRFDGCSIDRDRVIMEDVNENSSSENEADSNVGVHERTCVDDIAAHIEEVPVSSTSMDFSPLVTVNPAYA